MRLIIKKNMPTFLLSFLGISPPGVKISKRVIYLVAHQFRIFNSHLPIWKEKNITFSGKLNDHRSHLFVY